MDDFVDISRASVYFADPGVRKIVFSKKNGTQMKIRHLHSSFGDVLLTRTRHDANTTRRDATRHDAT